MNPLHKMSLQLSVETARGALLGLLVGDALGVPYEFHWADKLPPKHLIEMEPPPGFRRSHPKTPVGTWSDDGAQALALLDSLNHSGTQALDLDHFGINLLKWFDEGLFTPDGLVFDVGMQTRLGFNALRNGTPAGCAGLAGERDNGNGALMRTLPCIFVPATDEREFLSRAMLQGLPTHGHPLSQVTCALYVATSWNLGALKLPAEVALARAVDFTKASIPEVYAEALMRVLAERVNRPQGSGYVVDTFWSAWHALTTTSDYADCVKTAVALGRDTDTTACVAGGLAGLVYGEEGIPERWLSALHGKELALGYLPLVA